MTTSSEQVLPSPTKIRARKSRHRRNNSRGSLKDITSPIKSPTMGGLVEGEAEGDFHCQTNAFNPGHKHMDVSPSAFRYLGPATAIREHLTEDEQDQSDRHMQDSPVAVKTLPEHANLNDVCFGCDGGCSDATCSSSKRSSQVSADVESTCDSPARSPLRKAPELDLLPSPGQLIDSPIGSPTHSTSTSNMSESQTKPVREKDSNENLNLPSDETVYRLKVTEDTPENLTATSPSDNSGINIAVKRTIIEQDGPPKRTPPLVRRMESVDSESNENRRGPAVKFRRIKVRYEWF